MGWINQGQLRRREYTTSSSLDLDKNADVGLNKDEDGSSLAGEGKEYPFCPETTADDELPFIPKATVNRHDGKEGSKRLCVYPRWSQSLRKLIWSLNRDCH